MNWTLQSANLWAGHILGFAWAMLWQSSLLIGLVWVANTVIRRVREEAVDDAVTVALRGEADSYAPALLAVARLRLPRSLAGLGLVGILESRNALGRRIERLVNLPPPQRTGLSLASGLSVLAFAALAVPMGEGPPLAGRAAPAITQVPLEELREDLRMPDLMGARDRTAPTNTLEISRPTDQQHIENETRLATNLQTPADSIATNEAKFFFRTFKLDPSTFLKGLSNFAVAARKDMGTTELTADSARILLTPRVRIAHMETGDAESVGDSAPIRLEAPGRILSAFISSLGVDMAPPKTFFFGEREGTLLMYATLKDLDIIERAVQIMNITPPQFNIQARFFELPEAEAKAFAEQHSSLNSAASWTVRLTPAQARKHLQRWKFLDGAKFVSETQITTLSGRQCQVQVENFMDVVAPTNSVTGNSNASGPSSITNRVAIGPILDVIPNVDANGFAVQLAMITSLNEFLGYDDAGPFVPPQVAGERGHFPAVVRAVPTAHFRLRQATNSVTLWDGQTAVLGGPISEDIKTLIHKVPVLGDIPLVGRLFRSETRQTTRSHLVIVVTPTLIDPAGNRYHKDDEMPFIESGFPAEPRSSP